MDGMDILSQVSITEQQITFFAVAAAAIYLWHDKRLFPCLKRHGPIEMRISRLLSSFYLAYHNPLR